MGHALDHGGTMHDERDMRSGGHPYRRPERPTAARAVPFADRGGDSRALRIVVLTLVVLGLWISITAWREHRLDVAVAAMPGAAQERAFRRAYDDLSTTCSTQPQLAEHCRTQAEFILRFPQCTSACETLARRFLPTARR